ncbi:hypothetical protein DUI87_04134 [Hirundo rustica rustica]|uniref:Small monomeric GTPase n=1 Tax=Hirundo rustica rustica TaxID=333673 RepID=A0A3M0L1T4_HIRRU|nr:hypothetical protein DUI87_04134 [Hirundo rustica rustica]
MTMQFISHRFPDYHDPTIEDAYKTQVRIDDEPAYLDILDTAGQLLIIHSFDPLNLDHFLAHSQGLEVLSILLPRKGKTNLCSLLDKGGNLISADEENAEVLNAYFASVFSEEMTCLQDNCPPGLVECVREQNGPLIIQEAAVRELLKCLDIHKSVGPDGIHPRVMRELADELAKPLSIICHQSWLTGEVLDDWKLANVTPIHKKGAKEDPGNYRPVSLTSVPGKITEQFILSAITQNLEDGQGLRPSQHSLGGAEFTAMRDQYMRGGEGFIICYSITDRQSFQEAAEFKELIYRVRHTYDIPVVLVGNKIDLEEFRQVLLYQKIILKLGLQIRSLDMVFVSDIGTAVKGTLSNLDQAVWCSHMLEARNATQRNLYRLEKWTCLKIVKFNSAKCQVLQVVFLIFAIL